MGRIILREDARPNVQEKRTGGDALPQTAEFLVYVIVYMCKITLDNNDLICSARKGKAVRHAAKCSLEAHKSCALH